MLDKLEQMKEISFALKEATEKGDIDRVVALLKRRQELTDTMGKLSPSDPDVQSGKVAVLLKEIVEMDGELEGKIRGIMSDLKDAINSVQGEQKIVKGYLKQSLDENPKLLDKEG